MSNLAEKILESADRFPDAPAFIDTGSHTTYSELARLVERAALGLRDRGIRPDDVVLSQITNGPVATLLCLGTLAAGAIWVPANPLLSQGETDNIRKDTKPALFLSQHASYGPDIHLTGPFELSDIPVEEGTFCISSKKETDPAVVFFTSGTTGKPKGVVLSHGNLLSNAEWVSRQSLENEPWGPGEVNAAVLPLSHSFALTCSQNAALLSGAALTHLPKFDAVELLTEIRTLGITLVALVPSAALALADTIEQNPTEVSLRFCMIGGAPISPGLIERFERLSGATVLEGYGLTETSPVCAFRTPRTPRKPGSVGRSAGFAEVAVRTEEGRLADQGTGELHVAGPGVMSGYFGATEPDQRDEWLPTGDMARIDSDGDIFILDRKKDIIIRNGYNVYPGELEEALLDIGGVKDSGVAGIADERAGEEIVAFVVATPETDPEVLQSKLADKLAKYKLPQRIVFVKSIPRGAKGQVLRSELRSAILT